MWIICCCILLLLLYFSFYTISRHHSTALAEWYGFCSHYIDDSMEYIGWIGCLLTKLLTTKVNIDETRFDDHFICVYSELWCLNCERQLNIKWNGLKLAMGINSCIILIILGEWVVIIDNGGWLCVGSDGSYGWWCSCGGDYYGLWFLWWLMDTYFNRLRRFKETSFKPD